MVARESDLVSRLSTTPAMLFASRLTFWLIIVGLGILLITMGVSNG